MTDTPQDPRPLIVIGAGGHATSVANVALSAGFSIAHFVDKNRAGQTLLSLPIIGSVCELTDLRFYALILAVGDNAARERTHKEIIESCGNVVFPSIVHPSAVVSLHATIGEGTVVMPNAVVGPNSNVGRFCILNTVSSLDHDCTMRDYASIAPGAVTGGAVSIGVRSCISIGARVKHGVTIGDDTVIGANSYVNKPMPNNVLAYGSPAKIVRSRNCGEPYLD